MNIRLLITVTALFLYCMGGSAQAQFYNNMCPGYASAGSWKAYCETESTQKTYKKVVKKLVKQMNKDSKNLGKITKSSSKLKDAGERDETWTSVGKSSKRVKKRVRASNRAIRKAKGIKSEFTPIRRNMSRDEFFTTVDSNIESAERVRAGFESCDSVVDARSSCECVESEVSASFEFRTGDYGQCACFNEVFVRWDEELSLHASSVTAVYDWTGGGQLERTETETSPFDNSFSLNNGEVILSAPSGSNWIRIVGGSVVDLNFDRCAPDCAPSMASIMSFLQNARIRVNC